MAVLDRSLLTARQVPKVTTGSTPFWITVNIPTSATDSTDEQVLLFKFPSVAYIRNAAGSLNYHAGAHDSGTPVWVADLGVGGIDGVLDFTFASALDENDDGESAQITTQGGWIDVGGLYLILDTTTASSAGRAAADFEVAGEYSTSIRELVDDGVS